MANPKPQTKGGKPDKLIRDALIAAFRQSPEKLKRGAEALVERYEQGDLDVHKYVADRIDGKAVQPISNDGDEPFNVKTSLTVAFIDTRPTEDGITRD